MRVAHYEHEDKVHDIEYDELNIKDHCVCCGEPIYDTVVNKFQRYESHGNYCKWCYTDTPRPRKFITQDKP